MKEEIEAIDKKFKIVKFKSTWTPLAANSEDRKIRQVELLELYKRRVEGLLMVIIASIQSTWSNGKMGVEVGNHGRKLVHLIILSRLILSSRIQIQESILPVINKAEKQLIKEWTWAILTVKIFVLMILCSKTTMKRWNTQKTFIKFIIDTKTANFLWTKVNFTAISTKRKRKIIESNF